MNTYVLPIELGLNKKGKMKILELSVKADSMDKAWNEFQRQRVIARDETDEFQQVLSNRIKVMPDLEDSITNAIDALDEAIESI